MMLKPFQSRGSFEGESFDMTPIIDVVFLLIIFFMLVCPFIAAEQFTVQVPDAIASARPPDSAGRGPVTITVMADAEGAVYAIGPQTLGDVSGADLAHLVRGEIDRLLSESRTDEKMVRLRCDKSVTFGQVKHILSGISKSSAETVDWSVVSE